MKNSSFCMLILICTLAFVSCDEPAEDIPWVYELYKYTNPDDAQYVFVRDGDSRDGQPSIFAWNIMKEEVFDDVAKGNHSLQLSNGYYLDKYRCCAKYFCSSIKWNDLFALKSNKYAYGDQYVWCIVGDTIRCEDVEYDKMRKFWEAHYNYTPQIILDDSFRVDVRPKITTSVGLKAQEIEDMFRDTYGYVSSVMLIPEYSLYRIRNIGDEEDIECYAFQKPSSQYTQEEKDSIFANPFTKKAKDIRADYVKMLNTIIENDELDKYKYKRKR